MIGTNIMLTEEQHAQLKQRARRYRKAIGELVRNAVDDAFLEDAVERRRRIALAGDQEGFLSLGKLAETLGLDPLSTREYLRERGIVLEVQARDESLADAANA